MIRTTAPSNPSNSVAAVFAQHSGAEKAVKELKDGGFDVKKLSIIGSDYHSEENVVGFYNTGDAVPLAVSASETRWPSNSSAVRNSRRISTLLLANKMRPVFMSPPPKYTPPRK